MAKLEWGATGERLFETGVDQGVLYVNNGTGVAWSGLTSVAEGSTSGEPKPFYIDGYKYLNLDSAADFSATITAFSAPEAFAPCTGSTELLNGFFVTQQRRSEFHFSYRTLIGNDVRGTSHGYKIHLVYNGLATSSGSTYSTIADSVSPTMQSWAVATRPPLASGFRPTAHFVVDSTRVGAIQLGYLEAILYGNDSQDARMPSVDELLAIFGWQTAAYSGPIINLLGADDPSTSTVTNLFTNPSFETAGAEQTLFTNLFVNPSFEGSAGSTTEVRRNRISNPGLRSDMTGWNLAGAATLAYSTTEKKDTAGSVAVTTSGANGDGAYIFSTESVPAGQKFSAGAWVKAPAGKLLYLFTRITGVGSGDQTFDFVGTGDWQWVGGLRTNTAVEVGTNVMMGVRSRDASVFTFYVTQAILEYRLVAPLSTDWFDGSYSPDSDLTAAWTGSANSSQSVLTGVRAHGDSSVLGGGTAFQSSKWSVSGGKSLRIFAGSGGDGSAMGGGGLTGGVTSMKAGKKYIFRGILRITEAPVNHNTSFWGRARVNASGWVTNNIQPPVAAPGVYEVIQEFDGTNAAGDAALSYLYGSGSWQEAWWDDIMLVEGSYNPGYFDGSAPPKVRRNIWGGSRQPTTSAGTVEQNVTVDGEVWDRFTHNPGSSVAIYRAYVDLSRLTNGMYYTVGVTVKNSDTVAQTISIDWCDVVPTTGATLQPGESTRLIATTRRDSGYSSTYRFLDVYTPTAGAQFLVKDITIEEGTTDGSFFDGSTSPDPDNYAVAWEGTANQSPSYMYDKDFTAAWSGTAHASTSLLKATPAAGGWPSGNVGIRSSRWAKSGQYSKRAIYCGRDGATWSVFFSGTVDINEANQVYTVILTARTTEPVPVRFGIDRTGGNYMAPEVVVNGAQEIRYTYTGNGDANSPRLTFRFSDPSPNGKSLWMDHLLVVKGDYSGDYFDGDTGEVPFLSQIVDPTWSGAPHASTSVITYYDALTEPGSPGDAKTIDGNLWVFDDGVWRNYGPVPVA